MSQKEPPVRAAPGWARLLQRVAAPLEIRPGEAWELLERLPLFVLNSTPTKQESQLAERTLQAYAARKRVIARLARQGQL
jgi:hypothetical protein